MTAFDEVTRAAAATSRSERTMTVSKSPTIKLNNGVEMPVLGLGVLDRSAVAETAPAVQAAIGAGYRLIDTAASYQNEREVGEGLARSGIDRSEMFITTKLWLSKYGYDSALRAFDASLRRLRLDYVDMYLLHWPVPSNFDATIAAYHAAETLLKQGRTRAIGVSNFGPANLEALMRRCAVAPAVNQVELHPFFIQRELRRTHARLGIVTEAWSPLGNAVRRAGGGAVDPLSHPIVVGLAATYGKTPAQVVLRWHIEHGHVAIPKSFRPERIAENLAIFDFELTADELAAIDRLDTGTRSGPDPELVHAKTFPITVEE
jgi:diketogulonate reductase-like aldo/keto reductase